MRFSAAEKEIIAKYYPKYGAQACNRAIRSVLGIKRTTNSINGYCSRIGLRTEYSTQFKKGNVPANKGQKMPETIKEKLVASGSMFQKGHVSMTAKPVGCKCQKGGYWYEKLEGGKWRLLHHILWEQQNGPIPAGHIVTFKDKNPENLDLNNLCCVSKQQHIKNNGNREKAGKAIKDAWKARRKRATEKEFGSIYNAILNGWTPKY